MNTTKLTPEEQYIWNLVKDQPTQTYEPRPLQKGETIEHEWTCEELLQNTPRRARSHFLLETAHRLKFGHAWEGTHQIIRTADNHIATHDAQTCCDQK